jgi:aldehyde dehydrogenase (NAD+)
VGGAWERAERYLAPTVLVDVDLDSPVMNEETFGPILPVVPVGDLDAAIASVASRETPLALYVFGDRAAADRAIAGTRSGGVCVNDVMAQFAVPGLPFGGLGASGHGAWHGRAGFETFSHRRSILRKTTWPDPRFRYPPYGPSALRWLQRLL